MPFKKGDPRINRKGRPKSFDALRDLAQQIGAEQAEQNGNPFIIGEHVATNAEMALRLLMRERPDKFLEFAYGKVPNPVELTGKDGEPIAWREVAKQNGINPQDIEAAAREVVDKLNRAGSGGTTDGEKE